MKIQGGNALPTALLILSLGSELLAQGTAFTYQGRLNDNGLFANGTYDFRFVLYNADEGGSQVGLTLTNAPVSVVGGLFTVTLDFGVGAFPGANRWLQIGVRTNGSAGDFAALLPRQALAATPYAITAGNVTGTISSNNISAGSITQVMLASGAVGSNQLAPGAVTTSTLADGAVTAAKVFTVSNWIALAIPNPMPVAEDNFGFSIAAVGSNRVLVGAPWDDTGAGNAGVAYLFGDNGTLLATFNNPSPAADDLFGDSVAAVGIDRVLIGAREDDTGAPNAGAAYLFSTNGTLITTFNNPTPASSESFGHSVAAMGSDRVLIGAYGDSTGATGAGAAYLFNINGALLMTFTNPTPAIGDSFGSSVAAVGTDRVVVGALGDDTGAFNAGATYLFNTNGVLITTFTNPAANSDVFGWSVAAVGSDRVLVGAPWDDTGATDAGAVYLFSTNGVLITTFTNPTPQSSDWFGIPLAAVGTDRVLIGTYLDDDGDVTLAGAAYLFSTNGTLLSTFTNPVPEVGEYFGYSVAAAGSTRVLIGANQSDTGALNAGAAYQFTLESYAPGLVADGVNAGSINTSSLEDGAVTPAKLDPTIGIWTRSGNNVYRTNGNVGIGTTTPGAILEIAGVGTHQRITDGATGNSLVFQSGAFGDMKVTGYNYSTGTGVPLYLSVDGAHTVLNVAGGSVLIGNAFPTYQLSLSTDSAGKPGGGSWANNSDARIKKNIQPLTGALDKLTQLRGVSFEWVNSAEHANQAGPQSGFIAQEVERVFPHWVQEVPGAGHDAALTPDGKVKSLSLPFEFDALMVEALRELRAENAELKQRLEKLERLTNPNHRAGR